MIVCTDRDPWLTRYLHEQLMQAGVDADAAVAVGQRMSADISAAFNTLHRVQAALDRANVVLDS